MQLLQPTTYRSPGIDPITESLFRFWNVPYLPGLMAATASGLTGLLLAEVMPRGPVDAREALVLLAICALSGLVAGFVMHSRWAILLAPVVHLFVFEIARRGESGPTVDRLHFDLQFGLIALLVGRGIYVLTGLFPMALGAGYGAWLAGRVSGRSDPLVPASRRRRHIASRSLAALGTIGLILLSVALAIPAGVPAVTSPNGDPIPGSIAELSAIDLGGHEQWIEIRGASVDNPVILYLNGGPGQSDLALSRALLEPLHQDFTVVAWDQRGAGKSYGSLDAETLTLDSVVSDTIELTNYLRERFDEDKIYLLTESWGSIPGVLAAQQHPELYYAYIGSGQMVNVRETDRMIYQDLLAYAESHGDHELASTLEGFGPPPYGDIWAYAYVVQQYELLEGDYDPPQAYVDRGKNSGVGFWGMMGSEYTLIDKANLFRGLLDMAAVMYPQIQEIDFVTQVPALDIPVYIFDGEHELRGRRTLAYAWFDSLEAPVKQMYTYADAGHAPAFEHADDLHRNLLEVIVPATYPGR